VSTDYSPDLILSFDTVPRAKFRVAVPRTMHALEKGLQDAPLLAARGGMLFRSLVWPLPQSIPMWVPAPVNEPLDLVWLGEDGHVNQTVRRVKPGDLKTYSRKAVACVEVRGGTCRRFGIDVGTRWELGAPLFTQV